MHIALPNKIDPKAMPVSAMKKKSNALGISWPK